MESKFTSKEILAYIQSQPDLSLTRKLSLYTEATEKNLETDKYSLILWLNYIDILKKCDNDNDEIRGMYKMMQAKFGRFLEFWIAYIEFERESGKSIVKIVRKNEDWIKMKEYEERDDILRYFRSLCCMISNKNNRQDVLTSSRIDNENRVNDTNNRYKDNNLDYTIDKELIDCNKLNDDNGGQTVNHVKHSTNKHDHFDDENHSNDNKKNNNFEKNDNSYASSRTEHTNKVNQNEFINFDQSNNKSYSLKNVTRNEIFDEQITEKEILYSTPDSLRCSLIGSLQTSANGQTQSYINENEEKNFNNISCLYKKRTTDTKKEIVNNYGKNNLDQNLKIIKNVTNKILNHNEYKKTLNDVEKYEKYHYIKNRDNNNNQVDKKNNANNSNCVGQNNICNEKYTDNIKHDKNQHKLSFVYDNIVDSNRKSTYIENDAGFNNHLNFDKNFKYIETNKNFEFNYDNTKSDLRCNKIENDVKNNIEGLKKLSINKKFEPNIKRNYEPTYMNNNIHKIYSPLSSVKRAAAISNKDKRNEKYNEIETNEKNKNFSQNNLFAVKDENEINNIFNNINNDVILQGFMDLKKEQVEYNNKIYLNDYKTSDLKDYEETNMYIKENNLAKSNVMDIKKNSCEIKNNQTNFDNKSQELKNNDKTSINSIKNNKKSLKESALKNMGIDKNKNLMKEILHSDKYLNGKNHNLSTPIKNKPSTLNSTTHNIKPCALLKKESKTLNNINLPAEKEFKSNHKINIPNSCNSNMKFNFNLDNVECKKDITNQINRLFHRESPKNTNLLENEIYLKDKKLKIIREIGKGGSCKVDQVLYMDKIFALKKVHIGGENETVLQGYLDEIKFLEKLKGSEEIIELIDYEQKDGFLYILMEYGETDLAKLIRKEKKDLESINYIKNLWERMLLAVKRIHNARIVHRDLKPANFLLVKGKLKLIDFGISKAIRNDTTNINFESHVGTINYMAPEAVDSEKSKMGRSSDIWSLGCIFYEMIYGHPPLHSCTNFAKKIMMLQDKNFKIEYKQMENKFFPAINLIKKCLKKQPQERSTIEELLLDDFIDSKDKLLLSKKELVDLTRAVWKININNRINIKSYAENIVEEFLKKINEKKQFDKYI
ncbi:Serine/threonine kinase mps1 [Conglomerata obtusa]